MGPAGPGPGPPSLRGPPNSRCVNFSSREISSSCSQRQIQGGYISGSNWFALNTGLSHRLAAYEEIHSLFGFFAELRDIDVKTVEDDCTKLAAFYHADAGEQDLISECIHFKHYIYCWRKNEVPHPTISELYSLIKANKADSLESTFPNIEIALIFDHDADKLHRRKIIL